ncbi:MAG: TM0106 family RecB-like putative nuclease [Rubrivivax sp.]|nr:TM0106 family RecB-like putative nuclease [Rubrivivax sp.]
MPSPAPLTPTQLADHLACPHLTQLQRQQREGTLTIEFTPDPRLEALRQRGRQHEDAYVQRLRAEGLKVHDLRDLGDLGDLGDPGDPAGERAARDPTATLAAMRAGFDVIVQAPLSGGGFFGIADVLRRVPSTASSLPGYAYEPADTKLSIATQAGTILQLGAYAEMLHAMQGCVPERFHVVTPEHTETHRTADYAAYHRHVRARLQQALAAVPAPATYPHPVAHCDICRCWRHCDAQRRRDDHPSLIAGIRRGQVREFQQQGLPRVADIAHCEGRLPARPTRGAAESYRHLGQQARVQVASRGTPLPEVEALPPEPARGLARLPVPTAGDVFLDFEGDPFVAHGGLEYLTGWCTRADLGAPELRQQWALRTADEKTAFEAFIDFALAQVQQHPGAHVYHFGAYEPAALKRLAARHATRGAELDQLLRGLRFVDLHAVVREAFRIGVERYGLKELEPLHGYARTLDLRSAAAARRDVELALELGTPEALTPELRDAVARYNADDCLSTEALRGWLEDRRSTALQAGADIPRPVPGGLAPSEEVGERDKRIAALREALRHGVPEDPDARTPDEAARWLLAALLGYFRQEGKNAWWEYFRLRDLPVEEHLDEREVIGGLAFVQEVPRQGRERNARCLFRFPPQETAIDVADDVVWRASTTPADEPTELGAQVKDIDLDARTVVLSLNAAAMDAKPASVFRDPVVSSRVLEDSLLDFAQHVLDHGFEAGAPAGTGNRYTAACELLRRRPPRRAGPARVEAPLRREGEDAGAALVRLVNELDGGVLPVQGPPGSGKTTAGAKAILALAAAGKRVGITAVSHKVIDNLLRAVQRAAQAAQAAPTPQPLRLVHKDSAPEQPDGIEYIAKPSDALDAIAPGTIVGGTAWLWASADATDRLDILVIDEAGQMALAVALAAARAARNLLLLGDPQQLEQPTRGAHEEGADVAALVHLLGPGQATLRPEQGLFLEHTYRLHPSLAAFTSDTYYDGRLHAAEGRGQQRLGGAASTRPADPPMPFAGAGLFLVEAPHQGNQAVAHEEVRAVVAIARTLLQTGTTFTSHEGHTRALAPQDILVVAPYNAQVSALRRALAREVQVAAVGTVDKFQGQEAPVVIYSCTSSSPEDAPRGMAFLYDPHRFNVATSRARCTVIVVASPRLFEPDCRTPQQMAWANGFCLFAERAVRVGVPQLP